MANVKAAMEYAQTFEREAMKKRLSETGSSDFKAPTLIDVVVRHEQQIQELKRLLTPMMEFNPEKPLTYDSYDSPGPSYQHVQYPPDPPKEWVGLTGPEVDEAYRSVSDKEWAIGGLADARVFFCAIEAKLKQKNGGDSAIDTELQRLGYPL